MKVILSQQLREETSELQGVIRQLKHHHMQLMKQDASFTCGPASVQNLLRLLHVQLPAQTNLAKEMNCTPDSGTDPDEIVRYLTSINVPFRKFDARKDNLDAFLRTNHVLLVEYQDYQETHPEEDIVEGISTHFAIVVGFDRKYYYLIDPNYPVMEDKKSPLTRTERWKFKANWIARSFDGEKLIRNWGLIVKIGNVKD